LFFELEHMQDDPTDAEQPMLFHTAIYFAAVTISTVGYHGDWSPTWWATEVLCIAFMVVFVVIVPYQTGALIEALADNSIFQRASYKQKPSQRHVIITGFIDDATLEAVLRELFHADHGYKQVDAVLLCPTAPGPRVKQLLGLYAGYGTVQYIQGSPLRAEVSSARLQVLRAHAAARMLASLRACWNSTRRCCGTP
jgi:hypothetical protein